MVHIGEIMKKIPAEIFELLFVEQRTAEQELELDLKLYYRAKGLGTLNEITALLLKWGSGYKYKASWWRWENDQAIPHSIARNAIRKWANATYHLDLYFLPLTLAELSRQGYLKPDYLVIGNQEPVKVIVLGPDTEEVVVYRRAVGEDPSPEIDVTSVTRRNSSGNDNRVKRYGFCIKNADTADLFQKQREEHNMTVDEFIHHLLICHRFAEILQAAGQVMATDSEQSKL